MTRQLEYLTITFSLLALMEVIGFVFVVINEDGNNDGLDTATNAAGGYKWKEIEDRM